MKSCALKNSVSLLVMQIYKINSFFIFLNEKLLFYIMKEISSFIPTNEESDRISSWTFNLLLFFPPLTYALLLPLVFQ